MMVVRLSGSRARPWTRIYCCCFYAVVDFLAGSFVKFRCVCLLRVASPLCPNARASEVLSEAAELYHQACHLNGGTRLYARATVFPVSLPSATAWDTPDACYPTKLLPVGPCAIPITKSVIPALSIASVIELDRSVGSLRY